MKRGEIHWADLYPRSGSEQRGRRPVIVLSNNSFNQVSVWRSIIVVPLSTSDIQAKRGRTAVFLPSTATGLKKDGVAVCHQITTLDRSKFIALIGSLPFNYVKQIEEGILAALDISR